MCYFKGEIRMISIGKWIETNRERLGLTQSELGGLIGCSQQRLQNYEKDRRCPDLDLLGEFARFFDSELKIGRSGIEILSKTDDSVVVSEPLQIFNPIVQDDALLELAQTKFKQAIEPYLAGIHSDLVGFQLGDKRYALSEFQKFVACEPYLSTLGYELDLAAQSIMNELSEVEEAIVPFELGGLGDFSCNLMFVKEGLDASMNLSLYRPEKTSEEEMPDWEWFIYSELDGEIETLSKILPVSKACGADVIKIFVEMLSHFLQLEDVQGYVREYCKEKLAV